MRPLAKLQTGFLLVASLLSYLPLPLGEGKGEGLLTGVALAVEGDIVFKREGGAGGVPVTVFPHWIHRIRYKCYACHPALFEMKAGANKISMEEIQQGKFCGACHNGKAAWGISFESCNRCHVGQ
ncbi:MAG: cytochrome c3 family protein [Deltaproteobacteria bacterium]|nr:cytochrome c3 family protein [Deltaproteobacteria bacterium]